MGQRVRETERKYEAGDGPGRSLTPPDLEGLPSVAGIRRLDPVLLDAVYYDTAGLALAAHRTTLRRRTGGEDAGWHLKLPTGEPDTRTEVRVPLGAADDAPPEELRTEVAALLRGRPLNPVVRLRTTRHRTLLLDAEGGALAEIAHDEVTAYVYAAGAYEAGAYEAGADETGAYETGADETGADAGADGPSWTETEVELMRGPPALLDAVEERLTAAGLRRSASRSKLARALGDRLAEPPAPPGTPATAGEVATGYLREQLTAILALDPLVRRDQEDAVHRMRVATRRARSALKSFRRELDRGATDPLGAELKWLAAVLGTERDREVLADRVDGLLAEADPALVTAAVRDRLRGLAADSHARSHAALVRVLNGARYFALLDRLEALLVLPPFLVSAAAPAHEAATAAVGRDHLRLRRQIQAALALPPGDDRDIALHEARKSAKRARYCGEAAQPVLGKRAAAHTGRMKSVQQLLGEHQDSVMCRAALGRTAREARAAGEPTEAYTALIAAERARAAAVEAELPDVWRSADRDI
ncbi:CHAD domain-containing protein [Streptomyces sp. NPDC088197]|uniref:CYTH and CHAD domain-containing protein n=1 Tax=Streptomyces sp. NPDC088197 TaxID=3365840 RepID=UPI003806B306